MEKMTQVGGAISNLEEKITEKLAKKSSDESVVEEIPLDVEGKPTTPDKAVSVMARILNIKHLRFIEIKRK